MTSAPKMRPNLKASDPAPSHPKAEQPLRRVAEHGDAVFVDDYLGYLLGQANHALFKDFEKEVRAAGLGSLEWRVLATLSDQPAMSIGQLAQEVLSQQPTVTKLVQRIEANGWVRLINDPKDQRRTLVNITPAGQRKVKPLIALSREHEARALSGLSASDITRLKAQLQRLARQPV